MASPTSSRPDRSRPVHLPARFSDDRPTVIVVTLCVRDRRPILANREAVILLREQWTLLDQWRVGRWVVMPDHVHAMLWPGSRECCPLGAWVRALKSFTTRAWPHASDKPLWHPSFWDRQVRDGEGFSAAWKYIRNNPVRAGLVDDPDRWPHQGGDPGLCWDGA